MFDMLDSLTLSLLFLCKCEKGFSRYPVVGVEGHCGCISRTLSQLIFKMLSGVLDRLWRQWESLVTELFVPDYISQRIVTSWLLFN